VVKDEHVFVLLDGAMRALRDGLRSVDLRHTPEEVRRELTDLRSSQLRLLSLTPVDGIRGSDLAEEVGMTKQALSEFTQALQRRGLLESLPDPDDGRARLLRPTALGRAVAEHTRTAIEDLERRWRGEVGEEVWDQMRRGLRAVARRDGR